MATLAQEDVFSKADCPGAQGLCAFPCSDHLLGSGGCLLRNQYPERI